MKVNNSIITILLTLLVSTGFGQTKVDSVFISDVKFHNAEHNNEHAGSSFQVKYKGEIYDCTAKHVLSFAKTDSMKTVSFGHELASWEFISKVNANTHISVRKLVNENKEEKIVMPPVGDWLIFEVTGEIPKNAAIYRLRKKALAKGDALSVIGYPYQS